MLPDQANKLYQQLKEHEYIFIRTIEHNLEFDDDIKVGSVLFKNGEPLLTNPEHEFQKYGNDPKLWPDTNWSFNMALLLRRPREGLSEVEIIDRRWNNNEMWNILTNCLNSI